MNKHERKKALGGVEIRILFSLDAAPTTNQKHKHTHKACSCWTTGGETKKIEKKSRMDV